MKMAHVQTQLWKITPCIGHSLSPSGNFDTAIENCLFLDDLHVNKW